MAISQADRIPVFPCFESPVIGYARVAFRAGVERHVLDVSFGGFNSWPSSEYQLIATAAVMVSGRLSGCSVRCEPILPLLVSRILLNHQRVLCVPACGTKEVVERQVRCCWHNVHLEDEDNVK